MAAGSIHLRDDLDAVWDMVHRRYNCGRIDCAAAYALAVRATKARIDETTSALSATVVPATTISSADPKAPPAWDVWATEQYQEERSKGSTKAADAPTEPAPDTTAPKEASAVVFRGPQSQQRVSEDEGDEIPKE